MSTSRQGLFITFEGIDGSGKSTQMNLLAQVLQKKSFDVVLTRNPGGVPFGQQLREILLHYPGSVCPISELLLFMADRAQHMQELIQPALANGQIILCDRHLDSSLAYQGYGRGLNLDDIHRLNQLAVQGQKPHLTFLFDAEPALLAQRVNKRGQPDRLEGENLAFYQRVRDGYLALAEAEPERFALIDATLAIEQQQKIVQDVLYQRFAI